MPRKTIRVTAIFFCDGRHAVVPANAFAFKAKLDEWRASIPQEKLDQYFTAKLKHGATEFTMFHDEFVQKFGEQNVSSR